MKRLRHVKTVMQHHFIVDDGGHPQEFQSEPVSVPAQDFTHYPEAFEQQRLEQENALNEEVE